MKVASRLLATLLGLLIVALGTVAVVAPDRLVLTASAATNGLTPTALYVIAGARILLGAAFLLAASASRMPRTLRVLGAVVVIAGVTTPLFGVDRSRAVAGWLATRDLSFIRMAAAMAVAFGGFLIYATRSADRTDRQ